MGLLQRARTNQKSENKSNKQPEKPPIPAKRRGLLSRLKEVLSRRGSRPAGPRKPREHKRSLLQRARQLLHLESPPAQKEHELAPAGSEALPAEVVSAAVPEIPPEAPLAAPPEIKPVTAEPAKEEDLSTLLDKFNAALPGIKKLVDSVAGVQKSLAEIFSAYLPPPPEMGPFVTPQAQPAPLVPEAIEPVSEEGKAKEELTSPPVQPQTAPTPLQPAPLAVSPGLSPAGLLARSAAISPIAAPLEWPPEIPPGAEAPPATEMPAGAEIPRAPLSHRASDIIHKDSPSGIYFRQLLNAEVFADDGDFEAAKRIYERLLPKISSRVERYKIAQNIQDIDQLLAQVPKAAAAEAAEISPAQQPGEIAALPTAAWPALPGQITPPAPLPGEAAASPLAGEAAALPPAAWPLPGQAGSPSPGQAPAPQAPSAMAAPAEPPAAEPTTAEEQPGEAGPAESGGLLESPASIPSLEPAAQEAEVKPPPVQEIRGVLELKPPEQEDTPFLTLTYDFSRIPHHFALARDHNILEYAYYKYKPMLVKAQNFIKRKQITRGLNYYRVIRDQQIPSEMQAMIDRNIEDITEYLHKYLMSGQD